MLDPLFRILGRGRRPAAAVKARRRAPGVEALEDRWMPSTSPVMGAATALVGNPGPAAAATLTQEVDATFTPYATGTSQTQTVAQFNPALGQLTGVQVITQGTLTSDLKVENLDGAPSNVSGQISGTVSLSVPGASPLTVAPTLNESTALPASNGAGGFSGTSGHDFGPQSAQDSTSVTLSAANQDLSAWVGTGTVTLQQTAQSASTVTGSGNLLSQVGTTASGGVRVLYSYVANNTGTPAPGSTPSGDCGCGTTPPPSTTPPSTTPPASCTTPSASTGSLSGLVYVDANQSGHPVAGDAGVPGATVNLTGTAVTGQAVNLTATTGADGSYSFTGLQPGLYKLSAAPVQGFQAGALNLGSLGGAIAGNQMVVAVAGGSVGSCYDFGEIMPTPPAPPPNIVVTPPATPPPAAPPPVTPPPPPASTPPPPSPPPAPAPSPMDILMQLLSQDPGPSPGVSKRSLISFGA
jgi:hypothetical protein